MRILSTSRTFITNPLKSPRGLINGKSHISLNENDANLLTLDEVMTNNIQTVKEALAEKTKLQNAIMANTKQLKHVEEVDVGKLQAKKAAFEEQIQKE